ncbi:MAG TPA: VOC family protein [Anaerolineae bacterium]|nr:VOC family protein [Anaerolineae bacterium]
MTITGLNHVMITIPPNSETNARHFYATILGLTEIPKPNSLSDRGGLWFQLGPQQLHLGLQDDPHRATNRAHLAYQVTDLNHWRQIFAQANIPIKESIPIPGYHRFELRDPFGNRLEFIQPTP